MFIEVTADARKILLGVKSIVSVSPVGQRIYITMDSRTAEGENECYSVQESYVEIKHLISIAKYREAGGRN
jgi:hypothetical protein